MASESMKKMTEVVIIVLKKRRKLKGSGYIMDLKGYFSNLRLRGVESKKCVPGMR